VDTDIVMGQKEFDEHKQQHDILVGKRQTWEEQISQAENELKKPTYKTVDEDYRAMLIKVKVLYKFVTQLCNNCYNRQLKWCCQTWKNITVHWTSKK
jgi:hypothetical protein